MCRRVCVHVASMLASLPERHQDVDHMGPPPGVVAHAVAARLRAFALHLAGPGVVIPDVIVSLLSRTPRTVARGRFL